MSKTNTKLMIGLIIGIIYFFIMFSPLTSGNINFWLVMSLTAITLSLYTFFISWRKEKKPIIRFDLKSIAFGIISAGVLWGIFWLGNFFSEIIFPFAKENIGSIYSIKSGYNPLVISLLLVFLIGPAEEIFWRGYIQNKLSLRFGKNIGMVLSVLAYTLVHIWSFNPMLILAALVAGGFWGLIYRFKPNNLAPLIISHALWDVSVFILFPI